MNSIDKYKMADQATMNNIKVLVGCLILLTTVLIVAVTIIG